LSLRIGTPRPNFRNRRKAHANLSKAASSTEFVAKGQK
jgi:hypothetical protein